MSDGPRIEPEAIEPEAASLLHLIGGMGAKHLVLVGGSVPPMLAPGAVSPHVGTADLDLCMTVAFTGGATREYYKSVEQKIEPFFEAVPGYPFRWRKRADAPGAPLLVDFLAPESTEDPVLVDGTRQLTQEPGSANCGAELRPFAFKAAEVMELDAEERLVKVDYVYGPGRARVTMRHTGPVGLLVAKAEALLGRAESKDGYDIAWYCLHAAGTPADVALLVSGRPAFAHPLVPEALSTLRDAFEDPDLQAPVGYALIACPDDEEDSDEHARARLEAHTVVKAVVDLLIDAIRWDEAVVV